MARLRSVRLHMFGAHNTVQVYEEISGLPPGSIAWRHTAITDANGYVNSFRAGRGRLWLRGGPNSAPMLRDLVMDEVAPLPRYRPSQHLPRPFGSVFRPMQAIPDTGIEITNSYRHQRCSQSAADTEKNANSVRVVDSVNRAVSGAHMFAVTDSGPRGSAETRFLGFTASNGAFSCENMEEGAGLLAIGADGDIGWIQFGSPGTLVLRLRGGGRVQLGEALRGDGAVNWSVGGFVAMRFELTDPTLPGLRPTTVRFVSPSTGWEAGELSPGTYTVTLGTRTYEVVVPESGYVVLR